MFLDMAVEKEGISALTIHHLIPLYHPLYSVEVILEFAHG